MKELSRLLRKYWAQDQNDRRVVFDTLSSRNRDTQCLAGDGAYYERVGNPERVLHVSKLRLDRNSARSEYIVEMGEIPGKSGLYFEVYDRAKGQELLNRSDDRTKLVYRQVSSQDGKLNVSFHTEGRAMSFDEFVRSPDLESKERVVLFGEPDYVDDAGTTVSPTWRRLRTGGPGEGQPPSAGGGDGGGGRLPRGPGWSTVLFPDESGPRKDRPALLQTTNPERAMGHLAIIDRMKAVQKADIVFLDESDVPRLEERLLFTSRDGEYSHLVTIVAKNTKEFRTTIEQAAKARLLENKQVALITCGDAFVDTAILREVLLTNGALMVWTPSRQVSPEAASKLRGYVEKSATEFFDGARKVNIDALMQDALNRWNRAAPMDPSIRLLLDAASFVSKPETESYAQGKKG